MKLQIEIEPDLDLKNIENEPIVSIPKFTEEDLVINRDISDTPEISNIKSLLAVANMIDSSKMIINIEDTKDYFLYDMQTTKEAKIDLGQSPSTKSFLGLRLNCFENTKELLPKLFNDSMIAKIKYTPYNESKFFKEGNTDIYNRYNSPCNYFSRVEQTEMPSCYSFFFKSLIESDASRSQFIDWMAATLKGKLQTILVAIGHQGIGKTISATLMTLCHLSQNAKITNALSLSEKFNALLSNKSFICFNEVKLRTEESIERVKELTDKEMSVRRMGKDLVVEDNLCNYMMITNEEDGIKIHKEDRRFKVIDLTTNPMNQWDLSAYGCPVNDGVYEPQKFVDTLYDHKNIEKLFNYLYYYHKPTTNPNKNFFGLIMQDVESASLEIYVDFAYREILEEFSLQSIDKKFEYKIDDNLLKLIKNNVNTQVRKFTLFKKLRENFHGKKISFHTKETIHAGMFEFVGTKGVIAIGEVVVKKDKFNNYTFGLINITKGEIS